MTNTISEPKKISPGQTGRPLSPHLQVYRWQLTMTMSILHRISGCALAFALFALTWMLAAAALGPDAWATFLNVASGPFGKIALLGWTAALYYHLFNGIRHLLWDTGRAFDLKYAYLTGYLVWMATLACLAVTVWAAVR